MMNEKRNVNPHDAASHILSYSDIHTPAISTVHGVLDRHGLVKRRGRRRNKATGTPLSTSDQPNDLWCADYKGEFMLADRHTAIR